MEEKNDKKYVLIVDDSAIIRFMVKEILEAEGYNIETAITAEEAMLKIKKNKELFDLVIVDINLPRQDGFALMEKIKSCSEYKDVPVMILSGDATASSVMRAIEMGAVEYLSKPFKTEELVKRVKKLIGLPVEKNLYSELQRLLRSEINRAKRGNLNLSLILVQCEKKFKNEISGIVEQVKQKIRDIDTVFEINSNTLALILPITGANGAMVVIKKIKDRLPGKWHFGVATYPDNGKDEKELINFAKESLMKEISNLKPETAEIKQNQNDKIS
ncbi:MAG: phosphoserine phosphatase RsbU/P [Thermoanaerobacteraceae bacterium]|nr:phosphoserine phosphatase RsbU/P [Thermoanaerobacteraceae bacterium]